MKSIWGANQQLELFSGSLLAKREVWQALKAQLPAHTCLLVTNLADQGQTRRMVELGRSFRKQGVAVFVLSLG